MEKIEKQHERADERLTILVLAHPRRELSTKRLSEMSGASQRKVQVVIKEFRDNGYSSLYPSEIVEEDRMINDRLVGVTRYSRS